MTKNTKIIRRELSHDTKQLCIDLFEDADLTFKQKVALSVLKQGWVSEKQLEILNKPEKSYHNPQQNYTPVSSSYSHWDYTYHNDDMEPGDMSVWG